MKYQHYGVTVDSEKPTTGVLTNNHAEWLHEDLDYHGKNSEYINHRLNCPACWFGVHDCEELEYLESPNDLYGFIECGRSDSDKVLEFSGVFGKVCFKFDKSLGYACLTGESSTQVLWSKTVANSPLCSPCYPGQCSIDRPDTRGTEESEGQLCYDLPLAVWGESY